MTNKLTRQQKGQLNGRTTFAQLIIEILHFSFLLNIISAGICWQPHTLTRSADATVYVLKIDIAVLICSRSHLETHFIRPFSRTHITLYFDDTPSDMKRPPDLNMSSQYYQLSKMNRRFDFTLHRQLFNWRTFLQHCEHTGLWGKSRKCDEQSQSLPPFDLTLFEIVKRRCFTFCKTGRCRTRWKRKTFWFGNKSRAAMKHTELMLNVKFT